MSNRFQTARVGDIDIHYELAEQFVTECTFKPITA